MVFAQSIADKKYQAERLIQIYTYWAEKAAAEWRKIEAEEKNHAHQ